MNYLSVAMRDANWWAYTLNQTVWYDDPCGSSSPLAASHSCPISGVQPSVAYTAALDVLRSGQLNPRGAKRFLARAKMMRKWRIAPSEFAKARQDEALDGFISRNNASRALRGCETIPWAIASRMRDLLSWWLPETELVEGRFGPGACAERWNHCVRFSRCAQWLAELCWPEVPGGHADMGAHVARLCAVPKQYDKDRLITVEPAYGTFAQQAVRSTLLESIHAGPLRGTCMDLGYTDGQRIQRALALKASRDKRYATLDLKDASDLISWEDVQNVFPGWVVRLLEVTRSDSFADPRSGETHAMAIYAGMGNATTFVVETLFFTAYVKAFAWTRGLKGGLVSTFGDDVICTSEVARQLIDEGQAPCFMINAQKSFWGADALRESCGIFAYQGEDITVPRVDGYLDNWDGALGLCSVTRDFVRDPMFWGAASAIAADSGLPVWERWVEGYPSLVDPLFCAPFSEEMNEAKKEWVPFQGTHIKLRREEPRLTGVRCTDAPNDWVTAGLLDACLNGQARTVRRGDHSYVMFPASEAGRGGSRIVTRWHRTLDSLPEGNRDLERARVQRQATADATW